MRLMASIVLSAALLACGDASSPPPVSPAGEGGSGGGGAAGAGGATTSGTSSAGTGGGGGAGAGGAGGSASGVIVLSIATPEECGRQERELGAIGPGPTEIDVIALGRFEAPEPMLVEEFSYWSCAGVPHEVVFFRSASAEPDEDAALRTLQVPELPSIGDAAHRIAIPIDPPLLLDAEHRYGYFGVRMTRDEADAADAMCVVSCRDSAQPERNYWSDGAEAPFGWKQLAGSPAPGSGLDEDYMFSVAGRPR
ncbi:hypothetical protein WMF31_24495 [Sorangium sp. So ce1036]|uniref:hypothetical protein n=1 Tax=Sorangium sp. So ce1036 TaxID=3133328 RepID=UPI003F0B072F